MLNVTGTTFIKNNLSGGFALYESMVMVAQIVDSMIVLDMGSNDGTLDILKDIARHNNKIKVVEEKWTTTNNPSAFADVANRCVELCPTPHSYFWQADEILHEVLAKAVKTNYENNVFEMTFERIQLTTGGHQVKWLPHPVCRSLTRGVRHFDKDGMSTNNHPPCMMCPNPDTGKMGDSRGFSWHIPKPGMSFDNKNPTGLNSVMNEVFPWEYFLLDVSSCFRDNQIAKQTLHAPFWGQGGVSIDGRGATDWAKAAMANPLWVNKTPTFTRLPKVFNGLIGAPKYFIRDELIAALKSDNYEKWSI